MGLCDIIDRLKRLPEADLQHVLNKLGFAIAEDNASGHDGANGDGVNQLPDESATTPEHLPPASDVPKIPPPESMSATMALDDAIAQAFSDTHPITDEEKRIRLSNIENLLMNAHATPSSAGKSGKGEDKPTKLEQQFEEAMKSERFDVRGPLGQRFAKQHKKGSPGWIKYRENTTWQKKKEFRIQWCATELKRIRTQRVHVNRSRRIDTNKGTYKTFAGVVEAQGFAFDPVGAVARATRYVTKCLELKGEFLSMNNMTETLEFLYVEKQHNEEFEEIYEIYKREQDEATIRESHHDDDDAEGNEGTNAESVCAEGKKGGKAKTCKTPKRTCSTKALDADSPVPKKTERE